jgi:hypothetical protein
MSFATGAAKPTITAVIINAISVNKQIPLPMTEPASSVFPSPIFCPAEIVQAALERQTAKALVRLIHL